ncbi:MAG: hypothetical protein ACFFFB_19290 [Candidatus Heimdallarchaeota archaeon]
MKSASEILGQIVSKMNTLTKVQQVFVTDISGKSVNWDIVFQFNLSNEAPFYLAINNQKVSIISGTSEDPEIIMSGDNNAIIKICEGKGDFTHAISREEICVEKGKVIDVIRLTRAITIALKAN